MKTRLAVSSCVDSRIGKSRSENQDTFYNNVETGIFVVADGMGGQNGGATASLLACQRLAKLRHRDQTATAAEIRIAFDEANADILTHARAFPSLSGMGTTASLLLLQEDTAFVGHKGDSRVYYLRSGRRFLRRYPIEQLTEDHSYGELCKAPANSPMHHTLYSFLGNF